MSKVDRLIKRYQDDTQFRNIVLDFEKIIEKQNSTCELKDFIKAVKLAEYKNDLYQSGEI